MFNTFNNYGQYASLQPNTSPLTLKPAGRSSFGQSDSHPVFFGQSVPVSQPISFGQSVSQSVSFGQSVPASQPISFGQPVSQSVSSTPVTRQISFEQSRPESNVSTHIRRHRCNYDHMSGAEYLLLNDLSLSIDYCEKLQRELQAKMNLQSELF